MSRQGQAKKIGDMIRIAADGATRLNRPRTGTRWPFGFRADAPSALGQCRPFGACSTSAMPARRTRQATVRRHGRSERNGHCRGNAEALDRGRQAACGAIRRRTQRRPCPAASQSLASNPRLAPLPRDFAAFFARFFFAIAVLDQSSPPPQTGH